MNLSTNYLGLELANPIVPSASPMTRSVESMQRLEAAGAAAVVMPSLFEEQIEHEAMAVHAALNFGAEISAESAGGYLPEMDDYNTGAADYLDRLRAAKAALKIPVIAEFRDSQNFVAAMDEGIGVCELPPYRIRNDIEQINALMKWLDRHPVAGRKQAAEEALSEEALSDEQRMELVAAAAYRRAEERGFEGGDPSLDWLEAEREVDASYGRNTT